MARVIVPSIDAINAGAGSNGYKAISTFSGLGGSSIGYRWAGFDVRVAVEFIQDTAETYRRNAPKSSICLVDDMRKVRGAELLALAGLQKGELDLLDGSPPCSSFSLSGKRAKKWGEVSHYSGKISQRTDDLFFEYARIIDEMHPRVFIAENTSALAAGTAKGYFKEFLVLLEGTGPGYVLEAQMVKGALLGLPQKRNRIFFIGVRKDIADATGVLPIFPKPDRTEPVTLYEAFDGIPAGPDTLLFDALRDGTRTRLAWEHADLMEEQGCFRQAYLKLWGVNARYNWFRTRPSEPAPTITAKVPCLCRWDEPRTFNIAELKRIQSFPDDFRISGSYHRQWEMLGRAVPPLMSYHLGVALTAILNKINGR